MESGVPVHVRDRSELLPQLLLERDEVGGESGGGVEQVRRHAPSQVGGERVGGAQVATNQQATPRALQTQTRSTCLL